MALITEEGFIFNKGEWIDGRAGLTKVLEDGTHIEYFFNTGELLSNTAGGTLGMEFPNVDQYYINPLITVDMARHASRHYIVSRILRQIDDFAFSGAYIKVSPPEAIAEDVSEQEIDDVQSKVDEIDRKVVKTITRCRQSAYDEIVYGTAVFERIKGIIEDWKAPVIIKRLPAYSFCERPIGRMDIMRYITGDILLGIVYDKQEDVFEFWQKQNNISNPIQIPTRNVIQIRDEVSEQVDGTSFLVQILPLVKKLEFADMCLMQTVHRAGAPLLWITVEEYPDKKGELQKNPAAWDSKTAYEKAQKLGQNWGKDSVLVANSCLTPVPLDFKLAIDPIRVVQFLETRILYALIPRDFTEQSGQAVSKTSAPTLKLLVLVAEGWRSRSSKALLEMWSEILEENGYKGWKVEIIWKELDPTDEKLIYDRAAVAKGMGVFTEDEIRDMVGYEAKPKEELTAPEPMVDANGQPVIGPDGKPIMIPGTSTDGTSQPGQPIVPGQPVQPGKLPEQPGAWDHPLKKQSEPKPPTDTKNTMKADQAKTTSGEPVKDTKGNPVKNSEDVIVNSEEDLQKINDEKVRMFAEWCKSMGYIE